MLLSIKVPCEIMNNCYSKLRVFLIVTSLLFIWQTLKFLPRLQFSNKTEVLLITPSSVAPVFVSVFYEALCPDSKNFIVKQLLPVVNKAAWLINVSLIPYGKARTEKTKNGSIIFSCQHGPTECLANKIHACAISEISNSEVLIKYISCMISDNMIPELIGETCAKEYAVVWKSIIQCANSEKGSQLLRDFGKLTDSLSPKMTFVPTVLLNNKHKNQAAVLKDFFKEVCSTFNEVPDECIASV